MKTGAMICGIIGGVFSLLFGIFGAGVGAVAQAAGEKSAELFQVVSVVSPVAGIVGGAIVKANAVLAGLLMVASVLGIAYNFGVNAFTGIPLALTGVGALLAFISITEQPA